MPSVMKQRVSVRDIAVVVLKTRVGPVTVSIKHTQRVNRAEEEQRTQHATSMRGNRLPNHCKEYRYATLRQALYLRTNIASDVGT